MTFVLQVESTVIRPSKSYQLGKTRSNVFLECSDGDQRMICPIAHVSDKPLEEEEYARYGRHLAKGGHTMYTKGQVQAVQVRA